MRRSRPFLIVALAAVLFAGACGGGSAPETAAGKQVTVEGANGRVTIPETDAHIWALDDATALHLLAIGVKADNAALSPHRDDDVTQVGDEILRDAGVQLVEPNKAELVAAAEPDLIIGTSLYAHEKMLPQLTQLAPVLLVDDNKPWQDQLALLGKATGHQSEARGVTERLNASIDRTRSRIAESRFANATVSVLSYCSDQICVYGNARVVGSVLDQLGLRRPPSQAAKGNNWGFDYLSTEKLSSLGADVVVSLRGSISGESVLDNPLLDTRESTVGNADFGAWYGSGALNVAWILHDVNAILFHEGEPATAADGPELWAQLR